MNKNDRAKNEQPKSMGVAAGATPTPVPAQGSQRQGDVKTGRGGEQSDQISGETQKGAHNAEMEGRNPQGNKPNQNQSARQKGNTF
jgi:hypothetical protein